MSQPDPGFHLGLPAWAFPGWRDRYFVDRPDRLASYASVFDAVEGNTTFYRCPEPDTVARWRDAVSGSRFRFCLKLPREVTHEARPGLVTLDRFIDAIAPLAPNLGPALVQFPASVGPDALGHVDAILGHIDGRLEATVEVRHPALFEHPERLLPVLDRHHASRVVLDARPIYQGDRSHPDVAAALHKKPDLPLLPEPVNGRAFVRLVLHPDHDSNARWIAAWVDRTVAYLEAGTDVWMMIHCPNNQHCPPMARDFHDRVRARYPLPPLPAWPVPEQITLL